MTTTTIHLVIAPMGQKEAKGGELRPGGVRLFGKK
jgi:hypothetical protein